MVNGWLESLRIQYIFNQKESLLVSCGRYIEEVHALTRSNVVGVSILNPDHIVFTTSNKI